MPTNPIGETLLEMHYFGALKEHIAEVLGLPNLRILKPTPQREKWLGFDQGFVKSAETGLALEQTLRSFVHDSIRPLTVFRAIFLQFKVVNQRHSRRGAPDGWNVPWYAATISTDKDKDTKISQHETLTRLAQLPNTEVAYACPMLFSLEDVIAPADLSTLRQIDVRSAPNGWLTDESHKIAFQSPTSAAFWCSEPHQAKDFLLAEGLRRLPELNEEQLLIYLEKVRAIIWGRSEPSSKRQDLPSSLFIIAN
ncbi:MAG: hypothetical protein NTW21_43605 [Verrucomicrobia bacterium]|nr:hypothetical protein [Verrucomicrobiota bacterium]